MGRIGLQDLESFGGSGEGGAYFKLTNDKEVAKVRILLEKPDDIEDYMKSVHDVEIDGKHRWVNCLRDYDDPIDKCPFCKEKHNRVKKAVPRVFVPFYNIDKDEVQIFDRGKMYIPTLTSFLSRYNKPSVVAHIVEVERNGAANDMKTTYPLYEVDKDDSTLEDFPEIPEIVGNRFVLDKSEDDMNYFLDTGEFPPADNEEQPTRRRNRREEAEEVEEEEPPFDEEEEEAPRGRRSGRGESNSRRTPSGKSRRSF